MTAKAAELQREVRENAEDYQSYLKDLYQWETEIKVKDEMLKKAPKSLMAGDQQEFPIRNKKTVSALNETLSSSPLSVPNSNMMTDQQNKQRAALEKNKGNECFKEGKYDKAIEYYSRAMELTPLDAILPANRAIALIKVNRFAEAEEDCNTSLKLDPTFVKAYHRRGTARANTGKMELALSDFQKVLDIEPHNKAALQEFERLSKLTKKESPKSIVAEHSKGGTSKKRVSFDQSVATKTKSARAIESETKEKTIELVDLSLRHPSLAVLNEFVPVLNGDKNGPTLKIPVVPVNDAKQECLGIEKIINQFPRTNNTGVKNETTLHAYLDTVPPVPKNCIQFYQDWTKLEKNPNLQYKYLKQIIPAKLPDIFRESLETDILGGIIKIWKTEFAERKEPILPWLTGLSRVKRISAVTLFLSSDQRSDLDFLLAYIKTNGEGAEEERNSVLQKFS